MTTQNAALTINRNFKRAEEDLIKKFKSIPTGNVCDAQGRVGALDYLIKPVTQTTIFNGVALTVDSGPRDNLAAWAAIEEARPGDVIVIATGEYLGCSVLGDIYAGMAKNAGVVAIVTDGGVRDLPGIEKVGIPVFARGVCPNSPWKNGPGNIGLPTAIGGGIVDAGDILVGDQDGVVVPGEELVDGALRGRILPAIVRLIRIISKRTKHPFPHIAQHIETTIRRGAR